MSKLAEFLKSRLLLATPATSATPSKTVATVAVSTEQNQNFKGGDPWADMAYTVAVGALHQCRRCRHFEKDIPLGGDNLGVAEAGWCHRYLIAAHPLVPFVCDGYTPRNRND